MCGASDGIASDVRLLPQLRALEAERLPDGGPRYLFRGDGRRVERWQPRLSRLPRRRLAEQAHRICKRCKDLSANLLDLAHDPLEGLALLHHHGWPTPILDWTASAEVALAFAARDARAMGRADTGVVSVLDRSRLPNSLISCDAELLGHERSRAVSESRWYRLRGHAVTVREWRRLDVALAFDLRGPEIAGALTEHPVRLGGLDGPRPEGPFDPERDPIRAPLAEELSRLVGRLFGDDLEPELAELIAAL